MPVTCRVDCHTHTRRYSSCSRMSAKRAAYLAGQRGLDVLVLTEHGRCWSKRELDEIRPEAPELVILSGMELTLLEGYDVVVLAEDLPPKVPQPISLDTLRRLLEKGGETFAFVAHPFRYSQEWGGNLQEVLALVDGVEVNSVNILKAGWQRNNGTYRPHVHQLYTKATKTGLVPVSTTDAHDEITLGALATEVAAPSPIATMAQLVAALCRGKTSEFQDPKRVGACLDRFGL